MAETIPTHYGQEKNKGFAIIGIGAVSTLLLLIHLVQLGPVFAYLGINGFSQGTWETAKAALSKFYNPDVFIAGAKYTYAQDEAITIIAIMLCVVISLAPVVLAAALNPFRLYDLIHGDARKGTLRDIRIMEDRDQVGIRGGRYLHLGLWPETKEPMRLIETLSTLVLAPPGTGKCLAPDEPVMMADGSIKLTRDLVVGDQLMGPDGKPRNILATNWGYGPMYKVTPTKGRSFKCNGDHILSLRCSKKPRNRSVFPKRGDLTTVTVEEWLNWSSEQKGKWKQWRAAIDFPALAEPSIDPYFVGALLGDGTTTSKVGLHTADPEMKELAYQTADAWGLQVREERQEGSQSVFYAISAGNTKGLPRTGKNPLRDQLRDEGLAANTYAKSIPTNYKLGSQKTRLAVLAGLIDTDGHYDEECNVFDFISVSKRLVDDIAFIARSLGMAAYPTECEKTCVNNGAVGKYHRVCISGNIDRIPTRLPRKQARARKSMKDVTNVGFDIEAIGSGEYYGIVLDGDRLYLLDDFTVTHNTASFVVPSILDTPQSSFIVNDPKPELFDLTSGYRAEIGDVFMINWSATDKIDPARLDDPERTIFYPRFNVLSPELLPPAGSAERDTYLDAIANVLSPSNGKGGNADYFEQKGRAALVGFLHYICSKVADADPIQRNLENIPEQWHDDDMEPSIPMLIDMITEGQQMASDKNDQDKKEAADAGKFHSGDAMSDWLKAIVKECRERGYSPRAVTEITPLISMAPNERSGILGTMDKAFLPFKNAAVRERTTSCDFLPSDLRGMRDEHGQMRPSTLYVCVNQAEAAAFATITALLYEVLSREYLAYGPGEVNRNNVKLGPYPVCFMIDEFAKLPKIEAVMTGPDLGRSKKTMYCMIAQSDSQIGKIYSKEDQQIIYATTAIKYILPQNDKDTIKLVQDMVGPTTIKRSSSSKTKGGDFKEWGKSNESTNLEKVDFIRAGDISGMKPGTHIVIAQGFMNRPYFMKSVMFFKDPAMLAKVCNPRTGLGPPPAYPMPERMRQKRIAQFKAKQAKLGKLPTPDHAAAINLEKYRDTPEPISA
ncbi:type IV secretory system conjugative DNA transfer family protein [Croceicoccus gelatinilyticus]|uniref:type IV secretory system conjugative DNA transfer family protein n=1 Tax=Croceicoccus gelatinilyticus TaxID=2835536 RepID=UPI001BCF93F3|nr:type IV secretory system conjugative DNA transfer family protein [Croceicoccus gelatinilyticus]MBS7671552.1 type IV secretory system conjugative DNA transfer family protein [Croceicoccus gelatinilyticus]